MSRFTELFIGPEEQNRNNNINIIRFVAAGMVIYGHMSHIGGFAVPTVFGQAVSAIAVKIFFVLSGYLICQSFFRDENLFRYCVRRVFRILPGLIFVVLFSILILGPLVSTLDVASYFSSADTYRYLENCLLKPVYSLPGVFENNLYPNAVNGSLWTLPVEFVMYIILPVVLIPLKKAKLLKPGLVVLVLLTCGLSIAKLTVFADSRYVLWGTNIFDGLTLAPYFFIGSLMSLSISRIKLNIQMSFAILFIAACLILPRQWMYETLTFIALPYMVMSFALAKPALFGRVFAVHDYSYGLYLWGFPVQQTVVYVLGLGSMGSIPFTIICFIIALGCAMISWHMVENPCNRLGKRITKWSRDRAISLDNAEENHQ